MKLTIDTSIIMAAIIKNSTTRKLVVSSMFELYTPDALSEEIGKYKNYIMKKANLDESKFIELLQKLSKNILILDKFSVSPKNYEKAFKALSKIDLGYVPMLAVALETGSSIWSNDNHFKKQKLVKVFTTSQLTRIYF